MKLFNCQQCTQILLFENTHCEQCQSELGFLADQLELSALQPEGSVYIALADTHSERRWKYCENHQHNVCNWLVDTASEDTFCVACELNRHIPNLGKIEERTAWQRLEFAKHRLVYSLLRLKLPLISKQDEPDTGLSFDFISENNVIPEDAASTTGHALGQVTINASEANSSEREQMREDLNESYRTLIGHFRHEVGHYYWDRLILKNKKGLRAFRKLFGDERVSYADSLKTHYEMPNEHWKENYISVYASSHPWEDWAETWAHYLHIVDTLETTTQLGLSLQPASASLSSLNVVSNITPYEHSSFDDILTQYVPLTFAVNSLNRGMGQPDLYPFVLVPSVKEKLHFIHSILQQL
ncbi:zinc-binding metallopeptidase family protein [Marinomonas algicola]|uniref:zinc-binding metallopeptidase family protein n=1 Tax=Marinomonas algicola TaxID=2773454 RepID=UPI001747F237|nr:putative zinc-binding metallopeptidase [Marinomonas algicola]